MALLHSQVRHHTINQTSLFFVSRNIVQILNKPACSWHGKYWEQILYVAVVIFILILYKTMVHNKMSRLVTKPTKMACAPSEDSDQPGHPPSLISVFAIRMKKAWVFSYPLSAQRRLWSDWANVQADLSLRWAHMSVCWFCHEAAQMSSMNDKWKLWD